ncbi:unnamed protein product, partial [Brassica oleracea var. botrytis]
MLPRRAPLAVPKVRRIGFFTSIEPSPETPRPNRSLSGPAEAITSSSPLSDSPPVNSFLRFRYRCRVTIRISWPLALLPSPDLPRSVDSWRVTGLSSSGVIILWIRRLGHHRLGHRRRRVTERCLRIRGPCFLHVQKDLC